MFLLHIEFKKMFEIIVRILNVLFQVTFLKSFCPSKTKRQFCVLHSDEKVISLSYAVRKICLE